MCIYEAENVFRLDVRVGFKTLKAALAKAFIVVFATCQFKYKLCLWKISI